MNISAFAPRVSQVNLTDTNAVDIANGDKIEIWGFSLSNTSGAGKTVTLRAADGSSDYVVVTLTTNASFTSNVKWVADKGLEVVTTLGNVGVTIYHSNPGR